MVEEDRVEVVVGTVVAHVGTAGVLATAATVLAARAGPGVLRPEEAVEAVAVVGGAAAGATVRGVTGSRVEAEEDDD